MVATRSARRAERAERSWAALPKCGLEQVVLHHLADWRALGRVGVVCKAWKGAVDGVGAKTLWRSALAGWLAANPGAYVDESDDASSVDVARVIAGLRVGAGVRRKAWKTCSTRVEGDASQGATAATFTGPRSG